jgi:hypothetical protein
MSTILVQPVPQPPVEHSSRAVTLYALRELSRRAGVPQSEFVCWRMAFDHPDYVDVYVDTGSERRVRFPRIPWDFHRSPLLRNRQTVTAAWMDPSGNRFSGVADFKIPFSPAGAANGGPLFRPESADTIVCRADLLTSVVLTLSRYEETLAVPRDEHGRFAAASSIAWRDGFLDRPIVDEWGLAFAEAIRFLLPAWQPKKPVFRVKIGHDVDELGHPFKPRATLAHMIRRRSPLAALRDFKALFAGSQTTYQLLLQEVVALAGARGLDSAVYWKCCRSGPHDTGYNPRHRQIQGIISALRDSGAELGIHPSYQSFDSQSTFQLEVSNLKELLQQDLVGGRQDFLRWKPETWTAWEAEGIAYDASVGFADHIGFRAGTCHPYQPWLLAQGREANLLEIPLIAMDSTLLGYMQLGKDEALNKTRQCIARCRAVGGVFTLVWHNTRILDPQHKLLYQTLLDDLSGSPSYDWRSAYLEIH